MLISLFCFGCDWFGCLLLWFHVGLVRLFVCFLSLFALGGDVGLFVLALYTPLFGLMLIFNCI